MLGNWQLANQGADNLVRRSRSSSVISITKSMATYQVNVKAQNQVKYANKSRLDRDLMILQRALKKVPYWCEDEDWKLPMIIEQYENSNVNIYL